MRSTEAPLYTSEAGLLDSFTGFLRSLERLRRCVVLSVGLRATRAINVGINVVVVPLSKALPTPKFLLAKNPQLPGILYYGQNLPAATASAVDQTQRITASLTDHINHARELPVYPYVQLLFCFVKGRFALCVRF